MQDMRAPLEQILAAALREQPEEECLEYDELLALVRRGRWARGYHRAVRHIGACSACRRAYLELRAIERMRRQQLRARLGQLIELPTVWVPAAGAAAAAIVVVALLLMPRGTQVAQSMPALAAPETQIATAPPEVRMYSPTPRLSSDSGRLKPPKSTALELESGGNMPDFVQSAVDAFISAVASATRGGQPSSEQSPKKSPKQSPPIRLLSPDIEYNGAILETAPIFEWQPVNGAEKYTLIIRAEDWELSESLNADQTRYTLPPDKSLKRGDEYQLVLVAYRGGEKLTIERRFRVLSEKRLPILEWAKQNEHVLPLQSGMVYYYQLERFADALRCFQRAQRMYPDDAQIEQFIRFVEERTGVQETAPPEVRTYSPTPRLSSDSGRLKPPKSTALELESRENMPDFVQSAVDAFISAVASATRIPQPSSKQSPPIRLLSPDIERNGAILETAPIFEWQPVNGAEKYTLIIRAEDWELSESLNADQTRYTLPPDKSLKRGDEYQLVLVAYRAGEELTIKRRFRVLSEKRLPILEWAQRHERDLPLRSGMVYYYQLERFADALRCFQRAQRMYPDDAQIKQYLRFVEERIRVQEADF